MNSQSILESALQIMAVSEETGKRYFKLHINFSKEDAMTIYRDTVEEILNDLPQVLVSAIQARIIHDRMN